jgi:hypothetical protein
MSIVIAEASLQHQSRDETLLEHVRKHPYNYLDLDEEEQSNPEICLAALSAYHYSSSDDRKLFSQILETIFEHVPNFSDHKPTLFRFLHMKNAKLFALYMKHFGREITEDHEFLLELLASDCYANCFVRLPREMRMNVELLQVAVESVRNSHAEKLFYAVPQEALVQHESILFQIFDRYANFAPKKVPPFLWKKHDFIIRWLGKGRDLVSISYVPKAFRSDREICLALCRSPWSIYNSDEIIAWIAKPFLADKDFVLLCLNEHLWMFKHCEPALRDDFDVLLAAAFKAIHDFFEDAMGASSFCNFVNSWEESLASRVNLLQSRLKAHDEFMAFLGCSLKSQQTTILPLCTLDCDDETARGLKTMIARYLGFPGTNRYERLKSVCDEIVFLTVDEHCPVSKQLLALIPPQTLVQYVLQAIACRRFVSLTTYPEELWSHRVFVKWAAQKGMIHKATPDDFSTDPEICLSYYKHSRVIRETILPWISESLKSNRDFVFQCVKIDPLILNHCKTDDILHDFEVLLIAVCGAMANDDVDGLARAALTNGWADALVFFSKTLRAKIDAHLAVKTFGEQAGIHYFGQARDVKPLIETFLGIIPGTKELRALQVIWSDRSIFFLALGGSVNELCKIYKFPSKRKREEVYEYQYASENDSISDESDDSEW